MESDLIGLGLGAVIGIILAMTGSGGGIMAVPMLVFGLHLTMKEAAPVGLIAVGLSAFVGAVMGLREGMVRYRAAAFVGTVGMIFAPVGIWLAQSIPNAPLTVGFSLVLAYTAWRMYKQSLKKNDDTAPSCGTETADVPAEQLPCVMNNVSGRLDWTLPCARALAATGMVSGLLSGMLGAGGGFVIVPALSRFSNIPTKSVFATSLAVISLVSVSGVTTASLSGIVKWPVALPFGIGAVTALILGRMVAKRVRNAVLMQGFSVVSVIVAVMLFAKGMGVFLP